MSKRYSYSKNFYLKWLMEKEFNMDYSLDYISDHMAKEIHNDWDLIEECMIHFSKALKECGK